MEKLQLTKQLRREKSGLRDHPLHLRDGGLSSIFQQVNYGCWRIRRLCLCPNETWRNAV